ncbi:alpha/beta hydrolase [Flavobacterium sp. MAH-1]|uniref:Alpha/beta hydrolase n=1 Tax=Flavobacterium agri TaxID=2743471 RepID=A0A7Y8Y750_9FLAO|nr:alpha/beta hydrolase-fold protein [Flavobacterium agri]NUY82401.1 alpha/beta hydrolase [Flavobacterium agri]NYA72425.1 alpha/beta hydrolase [Flavobacterium agri]
MRLQLFCFLFFSTLAFAQSTASKQVSTFELDAPTLGTTKKIWVWLPKDYDAVKDNYPVLYMHDAQNLFDAKTSFVGEWNVDETLESLNAKVIVVGIEHGNEKRIDELTPFKHEKYGGGKADSYLDFIVKTLKPEIDKRYRTKTDVKNTAIMGSSLGGLVSFYAVLKYPDVFGKAGVFSPSFWFSKDIYAFAEQAPKLKAKKFYFLCGDKEDENMVPDMEKMIAIVKSKKASTEQKVVQGGQHNEKLWREHFAEAFLWLFGKS